MIDGLYSVTFLSSLGVLGSGSVTLNGSRASGGDSTYLYEGDVIAAEDGSVAAKIEVQRFVPGGTSVFGEIDKFTLDLRGIVQGESIELEGEVVGCPNKQIGIRLTKAQLLAA